ncbi:MAG TPA: ABC transporter permease, partial [Chryseosolibacter sp.]|nr:ABC transporter permease [Chryseosolibacter sp.]
MIIKDLAFALRNLRRNKLLVAINVVGLSIGISACLAIFLIVSYEFSFDKFQPDRERIYRVYSEFSGHFKGLNRGVFTAVPVAIRDNFTGIASLTNFHNFFGNGCHVEVPHKDSHPKDFGMYKKVVVADPDYFEVFNYYQWLAGSAEQSLAEPFRVVLTESRARLYFDEADPLAAVGREIIYRDSLTLTVSGIVKDIEQRTDLDFTDFISFSTVERSWLKNIIEINTWNSVNSSSQFFIKLEDGTPRTKIADQISRLPEILKGNGEKWDDWRPALKIQPFDDLHFNTSLGLFDSSRTVMDRSTLYILTGIAGLLLIIAIINFINLETAQASSHAREVGIRKALGSSRTRLVSRFLTESFIVCTLSVAVSALWVELSFIYFPEYIPEGLRFQLSSPGVILFLISCIVSVTILAGLYPAFVMSGYQPASALKNMVHSTGGMGHSSFMRKGLTIFQFSFSQVFVAGTLVIGLQLNFMVNKDLGFNPDPVVYVNAYGASTDQQAAFKNELSQIPEIDVFGTHDQPVSFARYFEVMTYENGRDIVEHRVDIKQGDTSFLRVYDIQLLAGRNVVPVDSIEELLINETLLHQLGFADPKEAIGETLGKRTSVVGVVRDFHTQSLHARIDPTAIAYSSTIQDFGIKLFAPNDRVADLKTALAKIEAAWKKVFPGRKIQLSFMNDTIKRFYENEQRTGKIAAMCMIIALVISCLGLFGLSSFTVMQRTKEIGIRKVLGATVESIVMSLSGNFLKLVFLAIVVSTPVAYYIADRWLEVFAYRMELS